MLKAYKQVAGQRIGDPLAAKTLCGPLHTEQAVHQFQKAIADVKKQNGTILFGGADPIPAQSLITSDFHTTEQLAKGHFVMPTVTRVRPDIPAVQHEVFVPILHTMTFKVRTQTGALASLISFVHVFVHADHVDVDPVGSH